MVKFTEIYDKPSEYDATTQTIKHHHGLRDIFINPHYIIYMRRNETLESKSEGGSLVKGLNQELNYTQLLLTSSGQTIKIINVVGFIDHVANACEVSR